MFIQVNEYFINTNAIQYIQKYDWTTTFGIRIVFIGDNDCGIKYNFDVPKEIIDLMKDIDREKRFPDKKYTTQANIDKIYVAIANAKKDRDNLYNEIVKNGDLW